MTPILHTSKLAIGQKVSIRWTCSGRLFEARGPVSKINVKSIKVTLPEALAAYPAGFQVTVPIPGTNLNGAWLVPTLSA